MVCEGVQQVRLGLVVLRVAERHCSIPGESAPLCTDHGSAAVSLAEFRLGHPHQPAEIGVRVRNGSRSEHRVRSLTGGAGPRAGVLADVAAEDPVAEEGRISRGIAPRCSMVWKERQRRESIV